MLHIPREITYTILKIFYCLSHFDLRSLLSAAKGKMINVSQESNIHPSPKSTFLLTPLHRRLRSLSAPVDSTQYEAGVKKEDTQHWQGKDLLRGLRGEERMCMLNREGQAAQLTSKVVLVPVKCAALLYII